MMIREFVTRLRFLVFRKSRGELDEELRFKVSLIILLQCLRDDVLDVGMCVSPKPMKSIPERVCHASIVRLIRHGRGRGKKSGSLAFYFATGVSGGDRMLPLLQRSYKVSKRPVCPPSWSCRAATGAGGE
jgi:hypothetical protein